MNVIDIARVCHEVNRAYCAALGDYTQFAWNAAPDWQRNSAAAGVRFHLDHPESGPHAGHDSWLAEKRGQGWVYGVTKDEQRKRHPCLVEFHDLPPAQQAKDYVFCALVHSLAPHLTKAKP